MQVRKWEIEQTSSLVENFVLLNIMAVLYRCTNEEPPGELEDDSLCHELCPGSGDEEYCGGGNRYWNIFSSEG